MVFFDFTSSLPPFCSLKETIFQPEHDGDGSLGHWSTIFSVGRLSEFLAPCPNNFFLQFIGLSWDEQYELGLSNITSDWDSLWQQGFPKM